MSAVGQMMFAVIPVSGGTTTIPYWVALFANATQNAYPTDVIRDSNNHVYTSFTYGTDYGVMKLNSNGNVSFSNYLTNAALDFSYNLTFDGSNNIVLIGTQGTTDPATGHIYRYTSSGTFSNINSFTAASSGFKLRDIEWDGTYYWLTGAYYTGSMNRPMVKIMNANLATAFAEATPSFFTEDYIAKRITVSANVAHWLVEQTITSSINAPKRAWVVKYELGVGIRWARSIRDAGNTNSFVLDGIAVDSSGNVYAAGSSPNGALLMKYDSNGTIVLQKYLSGGGLSNRFYDMAIDSSGNLFAVGFIYGDDNASSDFFIVKLDSNYNILWQRRFGVGGASANMDVAKAIEMMSNGDFVVVGENQVGGYINGVVAVLPSSGSFIGNYTVSGTTFRGAATTLTMGNFTLSNTSETYGVAGGITTTTANASGFANANIIMTSNSTPIT